jgi:hypothetical protein
MQQEIGDDLLLPRARLTGGSAAVNEHMEAAEQLDTRWD